MDNPDTQATLNTIQEEDQTKQKTQHRKLRQMRDTEHTKKLGG